MTPAAEVAAIESRIAEFERPYRVGFDNAVDWLAFNRADVTRFLEYIGLRRQVARMRKAEGRA